MGKQAQRGITQGHLPKGWDEESGVLGPGVVWLEVGDTGGGQADQSFVWDPEFSFHPEGMDKIMEDFVKN